MPPITTRNGDPGCVAFTDGPDIANALDAHMGMGGVDDNAAAAAHLVCQPYTINSEDSCAKERHAFETERAKCLDSTGGFASSQGGTVIAHTLKGEGVDASEDGTGRGVPLVFDERNVTSAENRAACRPGDPVPTMHEKPMSVAFTIHGSDNCAKGASQDETAQSLRCRAPGTIENSSTTVVATMDMRQASRGEKMTNNRHGGSSGGAPGTGISDADVSPTVCDTHTPAVAFQTSQSGVREVDAHAMLDGNNGSRRHNGVVASGVRRLTPRECERLQGLADDWTRWDCDGNEISDSARYRMIGNSVAKPCVEWILARMMVANGKT